MEVLLDSSFVISCVKERVDFLDQLEEQGFRVKIPREVMQEMKDLRKKSKLSRASREAIDVAMRLIEKRKVKKTSIGDGPVDDWLIKKGQEGYYIATLDGEIKNKIPNKVVLFRSKGRVGVA